MIHHLKSISFATEGEMLLKVKTELLKPCLKYSLGYEATDLQSGKWERSYKAVIIIFSHFDEYSRKLLRGNSNLFGVFFSQWTNFPTRKDIFRCHTDNRQKDEIKVTVIEDVYLQLLL